MARFSRLGFLAKLVAIGIILPLAASAEPQQDAFTIYGSKDRPPVYERDSRWETFYQQGKLTLSRPLITDDDIEAYDWDNQAIILTETASKNFRESGHFIVVLGRERLYGGTVLSVMSQMAVVHPVIYPLAMENRIVLLIRPSHSLDRKLDLRDPLWTRIAPPELKIHFERLGKLRQPWSEPPFVRFQKSVHRIEALHLTKNKTAIEADYDLKGTRQGAYYISEQLILNVGHASADHGPAHKNIVEIHEPEVHRKVVFPLGDYESKLTDLSHALPWYDNMAADPTWRVLLYIQPKLSEQEFASFDVVARINLKLQSKYDDFPFGMQENHEETVEPAIADSKTAEIKVK